MSEEVNILRKWLQEPTPSEFRHEEHLYQQEKLRLVEAYRPVLLEKMFRFKTKAPSIKVVHPQQETGSRLHCRREQEELRKAVVLKNIQERDKRAETRKAMIQEMVREEVERRRTQQASNLSRMRMRQAESSQGPRQPSL
jgi:hypothetical protein